VQLSDQHRTNLFNPARAPALAGFFVSAFDHPLMFWGALDMFRSQRMSPEQTSIQESLAELARKVSVCLIYLEQLTKGDINIMTALDTLAAVEAANEVAVKALMDKVSALVADHNTLVAQLATVPADDSAAISAIVAKMQATNDAITAAVTPAPAPAAPAAPVPAAPAQDAAPAAPAVPAADAPAAPAAPVADAPAAPVADAPAAPAAPAQ
jgi:hypothetical protein